MPTRSAPADIRSGPDARPGSGSGEPPDPADMGGALLQNGRLSSTPQSREVLEEGHSAWDALSDDRARRRRHRDYLMGRQWQDTIETEAGRKTEKQHIEEQGREAWQMNHLRPIVRNLKGQLRKNSSDRQAFAVDDEDDRAAEVMTKALREARRINQMDTVEADQFLEHLLGGKAAFHVGYKYWDKYDRPEVTIRAVNMLRFFYNPDASDRRGHDLRLVGEIHDMDVESICAAFAPKDRELASAIKEHYGEASTETFWGNYTFGRADALGYYTTSDEDLSRVIEIWHRELQEKVMVHDPAEPKVYAADPDDLRREQIEAANQRRRGQGVPPIRTEERSEMVWVGYFLTPTGEILWAGETPYWHQEHPYAFGWAEKIDNESRGLLVDLIDQQRLYNRMIQIMDLGMATSARGVLLIAEEQIPDDMTIDDFAEEWTRMNGVVAYKADPDGSTLDSGVKPEQVYSNSIPTGAFEWLSQMRNELQEVSGVSGAVMGEEPPSQQPASLYQARIVQSQTTTLDLFETYFGILHQVDVKALQVAKQYHDDNRAVRSSKNDFARFDQAAVRDTLFDVSLANVADTATYRQLYEQDLKEMRAQGDLTFRQFLEMSSHPKADQLLQLIERTNPLVGGGEAASQAQGDGAPAQSQMQGPGGPETRQALRTASQGAQAAGQNLSGEQARQLRAQLMERAEEGDRDSAALLAQSA